MLLTFANRECLKKKNASSSWKKVLFETLNISWHYVAFERNVYLVHSFLLIALFLFYLSQSTSSFFALSNSLGFFLFFSLTNFHSLESIAFFLSIGVLNLLAAIFLRFVYESLILFIFIFIWFISIDESTKGDDK